MGEVRPIVLRRQMEKKEELFMAFCRNCGTQLQDGEAFCPNCGTSQLSAAPQSTAPAVVDNGGFGWGLLGFCIPIVGLILFLVWRDTKPNTSKAAGIGALVSVIAIVAFYVLMFVIGIAASTDGY